MPGNSEVTERIQQVLRKSPHGLSITDISRKTLLHRNIISKYLELLRVSGQVVVKKAGSSRIYSLSSFSSVMLPVSGPEEMVLVIGEDGGVIQVSEAYCRFVGISPADIIGNPLSEFMLPGVDFREIESMIRGADHSRIFIRFLRDHADGRGKYFLFHEIRTISGEGESGLVITGQMLTREMARRILAGNESPVAGDQGDGES
jgi:PAS domain S-box-containing protein